MLLVLSLRLAVSDWWSWQHFNVFVVGVVSKQFHYLHKQSMSGGCRQ